MQQLPRAFHALAAHRRFIVYKLVPSSTRPGKTDKYPIDPRTGNVASAFDPNNWLTPDEAITHAARFGTGHGVGFAFTADCGLWFLDIDNCLQADNTWSPLAVSLCTLLNGTAVEISQSGKGLHIIGTGTPPPHSCKNVSLGLEFYHTDRFVALTGTGVQGDAAFNATHLLPSLVATYFVSSGVDDIPLNWSSGPDPEWRGPTEDDKLIDRALRSKSAATVFGNRASFADLWHGDEVELAKAYPSSTGDVYDRSSADAALAQHLAFWTGNDCERILRLMNKSALVRDKWERVQYMTDTIGKAVNRQTDILQDKQVELVTYDQQGAAVTSSKPVITTGATLCHIDMQIELFTGCIYVRDQHRALVPGGAMLKPDQFRVMYGGFSFPMDPGNERQTRNAWEAFTESQAFKSARADSSCFRPDLNPGDIIRVDGQSLVNTYWPINTPRMKGDVTPFTNHLIKLLPNPRDLTILISYMAACVQHKGIKFQWAPLIQGVEGNGKTLLTRCVAFAIGQRYSHLPKASKIAAQFNSWMEGRIFIGVEDVYVPHSQQDILEELKPMITGERQEVERKGIDQATLWICCNFMLNCNNKAALRKSRNDRRLAPFYTAQQEADDLRRDGMSGDYFPKLYAWLRNGGYEIVNEFLSTYDIPPEFNPANGHIAPLTSSTEEAIEYGLGRAEQEILEAIEREEVGFRGGWVSSMFIDKLLERIRADSRIPPNKRRDMMLNLGYDWHPALKDGRVNNSTFPDGGKPRLFIRKDNATLRAITNPAEISRAYAAAQNNIK